MSKKEQLEKTSCKKCLHYEGCLSRFRKAKKEGRYEFIDEKEYFAHSDDCDFLITESDVVRKIFAEIEKIILAGIEKDESFREQMHSNTYRSYFEGGANSQRKVLTLVRMLKKKYEVTDDGK